MCELCPVGSWAAPGSSEGGCAPCPSGKYNDALYAGSAEECTVCEEGKISIEPGASYCAAVEAGSIPSADRTAAFPCPVGTSSFAGAAACTRCAEGTVAATPGASYCATVEPGFESSTDRAKQTPCPPGAFSTGASACQPCAQGRVSAEPGAAFCSLCSAALRLEATSNATACACAPTFVPNGDEDGDGCTCGTDDQFLPGGTDACVPCPDGFGKPGLGSELKLCTYVQGDTAPLFLAAAACLFVAIASAALLLRRAEGGLRGALRRVLNSGIGMAALKISVGACDIATDAMALSDVLGNPELESFHITFVVVFSLASVASLYVLARRSAELLRKWRDAAAAAVVPAAEVVEEGNASATLVDAVRPGVRAALASDADGEDAEAEILDCVGQAADAAEELRLAAENAKIAEDAMESHFTIVSLAGEDGPMGVVTLWLFIVFLHEISVVLLVSFALNCILLGIKLLHVKKLAQMEVRRRMARKAAAALETAEGSRAEARKVRRRSLALLAEAAAVPPVADDVESSLPGGAAAGGGGGDDEQLATLRAQLAERDAQLAESDGKLAERVAAHLDTVASLRDQMELKERELTALRANITEKEHRITELTNHQQ